MKNRKALKTIVLLVLIATIVVFISCQNIPASSSIEESASANLPAAEETTANQTIMRDFEQLTASEAKPYEVILFIDENIGTVSKEDADIMLEKLEHIQKNYIQFYTDLLFEDDWQGKLNMMFNRDMESGDIDQIQDEMLKNIATEIFNGGFKLIALEGSFYPYIDYEFLKKYSQYITQQYQDYINIMAMESNKVHSRDAALTITWDELAFRLISCDKYLSQYPDDDLKKKAIGDLYMKYLVSYMIGQNNTPSYSYENKKINPEVLDSYDKLVSDYPSYITINIINEYMEILSVNNNIVDDQVLQKTNDIYKQAINSFSLDTPALLLESIKNTYYQTNLIENYYIVLVNGKYTEINESDPEKNIFIQLSDFTAFGDFDGDGINDAAAILMSGKQDDVITYSLTLNLNRYFYLQNIQDKIIGNSNELEIIGIDIEKDKINLKVNQNAIEKSMIFGNRDDQLFEYQ